MGDRTVLPLQLGFVGEWPPSSPGGDEEPSMASPSDDDDDWFVSDSDHNENQGADHLYTLNDFPRATCDYHEQNHILFTYPYIKLRGPSPIRLYPAFKSNMHVFRSDYNLEDKSESKITRVRDCPTKCQCVPMFLIQFIDINIAGYDHARPGPSRIFGFGMARLSLTSPARVISMVARAFIEFELCVRTEERPEDEPKGDCLIEGCTEFTNLFASDSYIEHRCLYGNTCALDVKFAVLINAVEARIDIEVLRLGICTSGFKEVIGLFEDAAPKPGAVMSFVVAVETHNYLDPYIEGSPRDNPVLGQKENQVLRSWWKCSFGSSYHCMDKEVAELGNFGELSVKINWMSYRKREF
ncbi:hypothetical protein PVAP13_7KG080958 [Panicum virgatum]|uniref:DUF6598 domain-containing protein n=1 Tax=Panicum virgatum TaxID=38727 RepID=A0A8T0Q8A7_PANVG|nr:hypothetical protein PVAP13_7KG080958 [Panicum virgatum]